MKSILFLACLAVLCRAPAGAQDEPFIDEKDLAFEAMLRQHLQKLDRWDIMQLLRTEREVDEQQKERARRSTNPDELALLAADEDSGVRFYVAANRYTPIDVRLQLVYDSQTVVRGGVALALRYDPQESNSVSLLKERIALRLAGDSQALVRMGLAKNRNLPASAYEKLAVDPDPIVRQKVAENPSAPQAALVLLAQDSVLAVQTIALVHRNMPRSMLELLSDEALPQVRLAIVQNINASLTVLAKLAGDADPTVREAVARHPHTPPEALEQLAADAQVQVKLAVAQHPEAHRDLLLKLADFPHEPQVRLAARDRLEPLLRSEIREDILERWKVNQ